eukprot:TRINITY_DN10048_c0_g1_i1.p1 TRINITY_DN10048_c0_g1~~TRINITY_DN10048_c0_g1_i1.p1  ORF type:complete len:78 (+),score=21.13 TRINITY_DN10048_c0_g1_i1:32-235(+)
MVQQYWRAAGISYIRYSNMCATLLRQALKEPFKMESASRDTSAVNVVYWANGKEVKRDQPKVADLFN